MTKTFNAFSKKLLGVHYERIPKSAFACVIFYLAIYVAEIRLTVAPFILFLMSTVFTAGIMWQALSSHDNAENMMGIFMLPFQERQLVFSYVGALGIYTLITKTALLLAVIFAVGDWSVWQIVGALFCTCNACFVTAACYALFQKKYILPGLLWVVAEIAVIFAIQKTALLLGVIAVSIVLAAIVLCRTDPYTFYQPSAARTVPKHACKNGSVWGYLFRYLMAHKNYLVNTVGLWAVACLLPYLFGQFQGLNVMLLGFAILSLNTPICILLSCDHSLEQSVRMLPGQAVSFCVPYCAFIFAFNMTADAIFLFSWQIQYGCVTGWAILTAILFALQSAIFSVMLEWLHPLRNWKIESDLLHHPRKYCAPLLMVILAGFISTYPALTFAFLALLIFENAVLILKIRRL